MYPNGNGQARENFVSVFLELSFGKCVSPYFHFLRSYFFGVLLEGFSGSSIYQYEIEMVNRVNPEKVNFCPHYYRFSFNEKNSRFVTYCCVSSSLHEGSSNPRLKSASAGDITASIALVFQQSP